MQQYSAHAPRCDVNGSGRSGAPLWRSCWGPKRALHRCATFSRAGREQLIMRPLGEAALSIGNGKLMAGGHNALFLISCPSSLSPHLLPFPLFLCAGGCPSVERRRARHNPASPVRTHLQGRRRAHLCPHTRACASRPCPFPPLLWPSSLPLPLPIFCSSHPCSCCTLNTARAVICVAAVPFMCPRSCTSC